MRAPLLRAGMDGSVCGVDLATALKLAELDGYDVRALGRLLPMASAGIMKALREG